MTEPKEVKLGVFLMGSIVVAAAALFLFGWLAEEMLESETQKFDGAVRAAIHRLASPAMTSAVQVFSFLGSGTFLVPLSLFAIAIFLYIRFLIPQPFIGIPGAVPASPLRRRASHLHGSITKLLAYKPRAKGDSAGTEWCLQRRPG